MYHVHLMIIAIKLKEIKGTVRMKLQKRGVDIDEDNKEVITMIKCVDERGGEGTAWWGESRMKGSSGKSQYNNHFCAYS